RDARQKAGLVRMKKEIEQISKATGLNAEGLNALETAAEKAVDVAAEAWAAKVEDVYRKQWGRNESNLIRLLDQMLPQVENLAQQENGFGFGSDEVTPSEQGVWREALQHALNAEQAASWAKVQDERKQAFEKETGDALK